MGNINLIEYCPTEPVENKKLKEILKKNRSLRALLIKERALCQELKKGNLESSHEILILTEQLDKIGSEEREKKFRNDLEKEKGRTRNIERVMLREKEQAIKYKEENKRFLRVLKRGTFICLLLYLEHTILTSRIWGIR